MACRREAALKEAKKRLHGTSNIFLVTPLREAPILRAEFADALDNRASPRRTRGRARRGHVPIGRI